MLIIPLLDDVSEEKRNSYIEQFNEARDEGKPIFLFLYMIGCGHCEDAKEGWNTFAEQIQKKEKEEIDSSLVIAILNKDWFSKLHDVGSFPEGYPEFRFIQKDTIEDYTGNRTTNAFIEWVQSKVSSSSSSSSQEGGKKKRKTRKEKRKGKKRKTLKTKKKKVIRSQKNKRKTKKNKK